jgi:cytochrome c oxidase subunit I
MPTLWAVGCLVQLAIGILTGTMIANATANRSPLHDTYYIAAHLHYVLQLPVVFGYFAGLYYLFPKLTGYAYYDLLGRVHFWLLFIGVNTMVVPQVLLVTSVVGQVGGAPDAFHYWNLVSRFGSCICAAASLLFLVNMAFSLLRRRPAD